MAVGMDEAKTQAFTLGPHLTEAPVSALLLHGFTGSPWELRLLGEALADRGVHVHCPRLPGHGTTPEAMLFAGYADWLRCAEDAFTSLARAGRPVVIVGLSMGALLGMILASRHRGRLAGLAMLAPVVKLRGRGPTALKALRWLPVFDAAPRWVEKDGTDIEDDEVRAAAPVLPRYPLARAFDLFALQGLARDAEARIGCPSLVIGAVNDHVVDTDAVLALQTRLPFSQRVVLQRGFHIIPRDVDRALAISEVAHFIDRVAT